MFSNADEMYLFEDVADKIRNLTPKCMKAYLAPIIQGPIKSHLATIKTGNYIFKNPVQLMSMMSTYI